MTKAGNMCHYHLCMQHTLSCYYIYMSTAVCNDHTDQCTMCKYGGELSLIARQHETITINSFLAVYYTLHVVHHAVLYSRLMHTNSTCGILESFETMRTQYIIIHK